MKMRKYRAAPDSKLSRRIKSGHGTNLISEHLLETDPRSETTKFMEKFNFTNSGYLIFHSFL